MSSNLVKYHQVVLKDDDTRIIDTNELVAERLEQLRKVLLATPKEHTSEANQGDLFTEGLNAKEVELLLGEDGAEGEAEQTAYQGPNAEEMIANAQEEIEAMKQQAMAEIEAMRQSTYEQASKQGYTEGFEQGSNLAKQELKKEEQKLLQKEQQLQQEYETRMQDMEADLMETLTGIYEHVFKVNMEDEKQVLAYLISNTLHSIEGNRDFIIHLSKEDYPEIKGRKEELLAGMGENATVEFIEDSFVAENGCLIETTSGIFDCGVDTQLKELNKQLRLLSYEKETTSI